MATIGDSFDRYGIELIAVETKKIDLPDDNKSAVFSRTTIRSTRSPLP